MAANRNAIKAGRAFVEFFADDTQLQAGLKNIEGTLSAFSAKVTGIGLRIAAAGAGIVAPLVGASVAFAKAGDDIEKGAARIGVTAEAYTQLGFAAEQSGSSIDAIQKAIAKINSTTGRAIKGNQQAISSFESLGLSMSRIRDATPEQRLMMIADALNGIEDPAAAAAAAARLLGEDVARDLAPLLAGGAEGMREAAREADRLGITVSKAASIMARDFADSLNRLRRVVLQGFFNIGQAVAPIIKGIADRVVPVVVAVNKWIDANQRVFRTFLVIGAAVASLGAGLVAFGLSLKVAAITAGLAAASIAVLLKPVALIAAGLIALVKPVALFAGVVAGVKVVIAGLGVVMAGLLSPIVLIGAAVLVLAAQFVNWQASVDASISFVSESLERFASLASDLFGGLVDAIAAGDLAAAAEVALAGVVVAFETARSLVSNIWRRMNNFLADQLYDTWIGIQQIFGTAVAGMQGIWTKGIIAMLKALGPLRSATQSFAYEWGRRLSYILGTIQGIDQDIIRQTIEVQYESNYNEELGKNEKAIEALSSTLQQEQASREAALISKAEELRKAQEEFKKTLAANDKGEQDAAADRLRRAEEGLVEARKRAAESRRQSEQSERDSQSGEVKVDSWASMFDSFLDGFDSSVEKLTGSAIFGSLDALALGGFTVNFAAPTQDEADPIRDALDQFFEPIEKSAEAELETPSLGEVIADAVRPIGEAGSAMIESIREGIDRVFGGIRTGEETTPETQVVEVEIDDEATREVAQNTRTGNQLLRDIRDLAQSGGMVFA